MPFFSSRAERRPRVQKAAPDRLGRFLRYWNSRRVHMGSTGMGNQQPSQSSLSSFSSVPPFVRQGRLGASPSVSSFSFPPYCLAEVLGGLRYGADPAPAGRTGAC